MYNNMYEEYINSILGTNAHYNVNMLEPMHFENNTYNNEYLQRINNNEQLEKLYPEIYSLIYPMIQTACMRNTKQICKETINDMVEEIYINFIQDETIAETQSINTRNVTNTKNNSSISKSEKVRDDHRQQNYNNYVLRDLIRILLLRELLGRPGNPRRPGRPEQPIIPRTPPFAPREFSNKNYTFSQFDF